MRGLTQYPRANLAGEERVADDLQLEYRLPCPEILKAEAWRLEPKQIQIVHHLYWLELLIGQISNVPQTVG